MYLGFTVMVTQIFITGKLVPIFGEGRLLMFAVCSYVFGLLFMAIVPFMFEPPLWQVMLFGITFTSVGGAIFNTASTSWVSKQAGAHEAGAVLGLFQSAGWLGRAAGPAVGVFLIMTFGSNAPLYAAALFMLPVLVIVGIIRRRHAAAEASG
jgi:DHA2 family metal-tetracycline-proton antiporter-like MFS transporter